MNSNTVWINLDNDWVEGELIKEVDDNHSLIAINEKEILVSRYEKHNSTDNLKKDNLVDIPHLNEPSILQAIHIRYNQDIIYTYTGRIFISVNPFKNLELFNRDVIEKYKKKAKYLDPHLYQIADLAYKNLLDFNKNQTILVSGESGAGKTYSARCIIKYLTCLSKNKSTIEDMVVQSNPILEAFGNAKTSRNDNSSRFGKFIKLQTNKSGIVGCNIETYLLEKIRVIQQEYGERNFHIFYQLMSSKKRKMYGLTECSEYKFLNNTYINCKDIDDELEFNKLENAFKIMGFKQKTIDDIFGFIACILHIGNLKLNNDDTIEQDNAFIHVSKLLNIPENKFIENISTRIMRTNGEVIKINMERKEIKKSLNSLAMKLYDNIFKFIVKSINSQLKCICSSFIGILDIFGFESFKNNYFEQFCINYTNERLQEQFNNYIFKLEQQEYETEGIDWTNITFPDNKKCLELIEGKYGLLKILDEECKLSRGSDRGFTNKIFKKYENNTYLIKNKKFSQERFIISHYAGTVEYDTKGFRLKNLDYVSENILELLNLHEATKSNMVISSTIKAKSVGIQFKNQLQTLMKEIEKTNPYYIRCIKPNDKNIPDLFDRIRVNSQIKYSGVLSAIQVSRAGYPIRFLKKDFSKRYSVIKKFKVDMSNFLCDNLQPAMFEEGNSKIFLKNNAYDFLEDTRNSAINKNVLSIQKNWRRYITQKLYDTIISKTIQLQCFMRMYFAKKQCILLKKQWATIILQKYVRKKILMDKYNYILKSIKKIQMWYRARKYNFKIRCISKIQRFYRKKKRQYYMKNQTKQQQLWEQEKLKLEKEKKEMKVLFKKREMERKERESKIKNEQMEKEKEIIGERLKIENEKQKLEEANHMFKNSIQRSVDAKIKMASEMERLMVENRRMQLQMKRISQLQRERNCTIN